MWSPGVWLALPPSNFPERFSRYTLRGLERAGGRSVPFLQCLPSRGFWHGGNTNALTAMTTTMTQTPQPHVLAWIVNHFGDFAGTIGGGFNVIVILWLGLCAVGLWMASDRDLAMADATLSSSAVCSSGWSPRTFPSGAASRPTSTR